MNFIEMQKKVEKALALLDSETADEIIGQAPEEYRILIQAMDGAHGMFWVMAVTNGMEDSEDTRRMAGQGKMAMLTILHYAYALGVKHGMGKSD